MAAEVIAVSSIDKLAGVVPVNEVVLRGRVSAEPETRELPSGDVVVTWRIVVPRPPDRAGPGARVDALECAAWGGRVRRTVSSWRTDDVVEVSGALRRRFFHRAGGTSSRVEVDVTRARLIRRAATG